MEVIEAINNRYSCRDYTGEPVEKEKLRQVLEAVRLAPSAMNKQSWRFVIITDTATKEKLAEVANNQKFLAKAGAIVVACSVSKDSMRCGQRIAPIDVAIALDHLTLRATELGLATCWIGSFYPDKVRPILGIPDDIEIVELMAIGYPAGKPKQTERLKLNEIICYEKWQF